MGRNRHGAITVEQLFALNEEIRALVRAGVPLERGLLTAARGLRGRLGRITEALADRLNRGESLIEALENEKQVLPPLYRAVVEAGARSGQLPVALEGLARYVPRLFRGPDLDRAGALVPAGGSQPGLRAFRGTGGGNRAEVSRRV